jgi:hypothetical protein
MITRDEIKTILFVLGNEYENFLPNSDSQLALKIDTWHQLLIAYTFEQVNAAVFKLMGGKVYGRPKVGDVLAILNPPVEAVNEGIEYAQSIMDLVSRYGAYGMSKKVRQRWGDVGWSVYMQCRQELAALLVRQEGTFKAQLRDLYNSCKEREKRGELKELPYVREDIRLLHAPDPDYPAKAVQREIDFWRGDH